MEQAFQSEPKYAAVNIETSGYLQERRLRVVLEQEREVACRHDHVLRITFRKSDEEERLVSLLSKQPD
ncbi:MAG TPA: hypothetical protein VK658_04760 [Chryseolinea sp.]|nr:hypothetical protein [Chryseolinea sp.]